MMLVFVSAGMGLCEASRAEALDTGLKPDTPSGNEEIAQVFKDMGVVQRRAMEKGGRFLFSSFGSFDFSDGPYTLYSFNTNPGYAVSDFFEIYANLAPVFVSSARDIVKKVGGLTLANGQTASIVAAKPKTQFGAELLWAPAYGKDSLGLRSIVRSDTFLKLGVGRINYDAGNGMRFVLGVGKTFFLGKTVGLRGVVNLGHVQTIVDGAKAFRTMALLEAGMMFYL